MDAVVIWLGLLAFAQAFHTAMDVIASADSTQRDFMRIRTPSKQDFGKRPAKPAIVLRIDRLALGTEQSSSY